MKKLLLIMAAALMTMTQCKKQETMPVTPATDTIKMTVTAGSGAKTDINTETGAITWSAGDKLYVSDGTNWLGSLTLVGEGGSAQGTFTGSIAGIGEGETPCHFFYLGHDNGMTEPTGTAAASISFAAQDGTLAGAMKYHTGYGSTDVTVQDGEYAGYVIMDTKIAIAHINFTTDGTSAYTGSLTMGGMGIFNTLSVNPDGSTFSGSGDEGITIGNGGGTTGERYVTLIPTETTEVLNVSFTGDATGGMTFAKGIHENKFYGKDTPIAVTLESTKVPVESVSLDKTSLSLEEGKTETLVATVSPNDATDKSVTWSSDDESVATVDNGVVTAVGAGSTTITVTTVDGGKTATCDVTVTPGHECVDLGLPSGLKWATCNMGADSPEKYGDYYAWGETNTKNKYDWSTYNWCSGAYNNLTKYNNDSNFGTIDGKEVLEMDDDAARANWGGDWRMPTTEEWKELYDNTTSVWTSNYNGTGVKGRIFTSKSNSNTLFLPAAGLRDGTSVLSVGYYGCYWSSSLYSSEPFEAYDMFLMSDNVYPQSYGERFQGLSVRPVQ